MYIRKLVQSFPVFWYIAYSTLRLKPSVTVLANMSPEKNLLDMVTVTASVV
jgi:hypothetical protein